MSLKRNLKFIINGIIKRGYWYNNIEFQDCRKFHKYNNFHTKVVNLGSTSAVFAFNYECSNIKCANWALRRNPLLGDLSILKNYCSFLDPEEAYVIIPLCPFTSLSGSYKYLDDRYYSILYPTMIPDYSYLHDLQVQKKWNEPMWYYPLYAFFVDTYKFIIKNRDRELTTEQMNADAQNKINSWCSEFSLEKLSSKFSLVNQDAISDAIELLNQIIIFSTEHNWHPVIVIPPVHESLANFFSPEIKNKLISPLIDNIKDKNVRVFDYLNNEKFSKDKSLFKDSFLLNGKGAKKFTQTILMDLNLE